MWNDILEIEFIMRKLICLSLLMLITVLLMGQTRLSVVDSAIPCFLDSDTHVIAPLLSF